MDSPIASVGLQPAAHRPLELDRARPAESSAPSQGRVKREASETPSFAADARRQLDSRLTAQRSIERDADTGSLVYRLVDLSSGIVTVQTPSDARLRLRAYLDGVIAQASPPAVEVRA